MRDHAISFQFFWRSSLYFKIMPIIRATTKKALLGQNWGTISAPQNPRSLQIEESYFYTPPAASKVLEQKLQFNIFTWCFGNA